MASEKEFSKSVVEALRSSGWFVTRIEDKYSSGVPDLIAIKDGRHVFLELKVDNGRGISVRPMQVPWMRALCNHGGEGYFVVLRPNGSVDYLDYNFDKVGDTI